MTDAGKAYCWGNNADGQLGNGSIAPAIVPAPVSGLDSGVTSMAAGAYHTCAVASGQVLCWGSPFPGDLTDTTRDRLLPVPVAGLSGVTAIAAGGEHTCVLRAGDVLCWGNNEFGQLGNGSFDASPVPTPVAGIPSAVTAISAGYNHVCALTSSETYCWGANDSGQLGNGTTKNSALPVAVAGRGNATQVAAGAYHTCAINAAGGAACWGSNAYGQLGDGTVATRLVPVPVSGLASNVQALASGALHTCAALAGGSVKCWGDNSFGELAIGGGASLKPADAVGIPAPLTAIVAGERHTCGLTAQRGIVCWGDDSLSELGDGQSIAVATPAVVRSLGASVRIGSGIFHSCALTEAGSVYCWGENGQGQLGASMLPSVANSSLPVAVPIPPATDLALGSFFSCALTSTDVRCWGNNLSGQVGDSGYQNFHPAAAVINGLTSSIRSIAAGAFHACAVSVQGAALCWGSNRHGQLGASTPVTTTVATQVPGLPEIGAVALGSEHSCALTTAGSVLCWGGNDRGQLGDGTTVDHVAPKQVSGLSSGITAIASGNVHSCALRNDGAVLCWGSNLYGALGNGSSSDSSTPVLVAGLPSGIVALAAGVNHTCALTQAGYIVCWGYNSSGALGDATYANRATPAVTFQKGGNGSLATNDWFLDLEPGTSKVIPPDKIPAFLANARGSVVTAVVEVSANVQFRGHDVGNPVYVFGYAPTSLVKGAPQPKDGPSCALVQLSPSGLPQQVSASSLQAYASTVLSTQGQSISILNGTQAAHVAGSTFCVGTASSSANAVGASNSRCMATVPPISSTDPTCLAPAAIANSPSVLSGLWWNANESGWGIHFTQRSNIVFAAWYTYDGTGTPKWYVSTCTMPTGTTGASGACNGSIYEVSGPTFFGTTFNPQLANAVQNGNLAVNFQNADNASMTYSGVSGQTRTVPITRQPLATGAAPAVNYTDIWWGGASESGWGLAITQQANTAFLAWYVYDNSGKPMWYVATCTVTGTTCAGDLLRTTGPPFGPTFSSNQVNSFTAGTVSVNFTDANNGTINYTVNGVSGSKAITRQLF